MVAAPASRTRMALTLAAALAATAGLSGCAVDNVLPKTYGDVPEGATVEGAPWPRLVDNPASLERAEAEKRISRGGALSAEMEARVSALETEAELLLSQPSTAGSLSDRAAAARARASELDIDE